MRAPLLFAIVALSFLVGPPADAATRLWNPVGDGISWEDPDNWMPVGEPGSSDTVWVDDVDTVRVSTAATAEYLVLGLQMTPILHIASGSLLLHDGGDIPMGTLVLEEGAALEIGEEGRSDATLRNRWLGEIHLLGGEVGGSGTLSNEATVQVLAPDTVGVSVGFI